MLLMIILVFLSVVSVVPGAWAQQSRQEEPLDKQLARCRGQLTAANGAANGMIGGCMQSGGDLSVIIESTQTENAQLKVRVKQLEDDLKKAKDPQSVPDKPASNPTTPEG